MRSIRLSFVAATLAGAVAFACGAPLRNADPVPAVNCQPLPGASASSDTALVTNSTSLLAEALPTPISTQGIQFSKPELAEQIPVEAAASYEIRLLRDVTGEVAGAIDVALDGGRPRRLLASQSTITIAQLLAADTELTAGAHWLFAAPVLDSGLVSRKAANLPRAAVARRFFIGKAAPNEPGPTGAVWLRKPEGTYNGAQAADHVLFDVFVFSASGAPLEAPYTLTLHGPHVSGDLRLLSPFAVRNMPSGDYEVVISALGSQPLAARFVVNRELGGTP